MFVLSRRFHQIGQLFTILLRFTLNLRFFPLRKYSIFFLSRDSFCKLQSPPRSSLASSVSFFLLYPFSNIYIVSLSSISTHLAIVFRLKFLNTYIHLQEPLDYITLHLQKQCTNLSYTVLSHCPESCLVSKHSNATLSYTWLENHLTTTSFLTSELFYDNLLNRSDSVVYIGSDVCDIPFHRKRLHFLSHLDQSSFPIEIYGRSITGMFNSYTRYHGSVADKETVFLASKYALILENAFEPYYISEKIIDALLCGCMVIYYGSPSFIRLTGPIPIFPMKSLDLDSFAQAYKAASLFPHNTYTATLRSNLYRIHNSFSHSLNPSGFILDVFNSLGQS